jgi:Lipase (class 3)
MKIVSLLAGLAMFGRTLVAFEITETLLDRSYNSLQLAHATRNQDPGGLQQNSFQVYGAYAYMQGGVAIDYVIVAQKDSVCYVTWRGSIYNYNDWQQNFDIKPMAVGSCEVHTGFDENYSNTRAEVDAAISECLHNCTANDCPLVLSGHSQGGGSAVVASLYWLDASPMVITFGAPRAVQPNCAVLQANNNYRFVTVQASAHGMLYDAVPMLPLVGAKHYGHTFYLSDTNDIAYMGMDENSDSPVPSVANHFLPRYYDRLEQVRQTATYPMYTYGWENNMPCGYDDECLSGRCDGLPLPSTCKPLKQSCDICSENSDCVSGKCVYIASMIQSYCAEDTYGNIADGCRCDWSSQCQSGYCGGVLPPYNCHAKLTNGNSCTTDASCLSGNCDGWVWDLTCK